MSQILILVQGVFHVPTLEGHRIDAAIAGLEDLRAFASLAMVDEGLILLADREGRQIMTLRAKVDIRV